MKEWKETTRYGKSNPVIIWKKGRTTMKLSLHGKEKMIWIITIKKPTKAERKIHFKTDELAQDYARAYMRRH